MEDGIHELGYSGSSNERFLWARSRDRFKNRANGSWPRTKIRRSHEQSGSLHWCFVSLMSELTDVRMTSDI